MNVKPVTMRNTGDYFKMQSHMMNSVQFIREFVVNMIEAGASQGIIGFMFLAGHIKMILTDNGRGMNEQEMEDYLGELASSSSVIGLGEHHGIGAKVSAAFRNPLGVVYQSFTDPTDHKELGNMVTFGYDPSTEDWGLECEADESGRPVVVDYADLSKSEFKKLFISKTQTEVKTGTTILLRGSSPEEDTTLAPADFVPVQTKARKGEAAGTWIHNVLTWKFFEFPPSFSLRVRRPDTDTQHPNAGFKQYVDSHSEARGQVTAPDGEYRWWYLKKDDKPRQSGEDRPNGTDSRYNIQRGFGLLHSNRKMGFTEIYDPKVGVGFMRGFGFTLAAKNLVVMYEPYNAAPDEKRLHLCHESTGNDYDISEIQHQFAIRKPAELVAIEARLSTEHSEDMNITPENIKKWVKDAGEELPFTDRLIASRHGEQAADEELGHGGSKETGPPRKPSTRDPDSETGRTGTDKDGSGDAEEEKVGLTEGTGRRATRRQAAPLEDCAINWLDTDEFDHKCAAEYLTVAGESCININKGYDLFGHILDNMQNTKNVTGEQIMNELKLAVGKRLIFCMSALIAKSKSSAYGKVWFDSAKTPEALTAAIEVARMDILSDVKRNLGRFEDLPQQDDA